jgi:hypothetical protein
MTESPGLEEQAVDFAQRLEDMLTAVLGPAADQYTASPQGMRKGRQNKFLIQSANPQGVPLNVGGNTILRLSYSYQCSCKDEKAHLQIDDSSITLRAESDPAPIVHYDYVRNVQGTIPAAHINIHASNDSATKAMLACGSKSQGKNRRKAFLDKGTFPTFSSLHFPVGGDRFRPGLEDVLQMAVYEFGIDVQNGWEAFIDESRQEYRERQFRALVREYPDLAYDALIENGYGVARRPQRLERDGRPSSLMRY